MPKGMSHKMEMGYGKKPKSGGKYAGALKPRGKTKYTGAMSPKSRKSKSY